MLMLEQRIQQQFYENADGLNQAAEMLSRPVADAAQAMAACITSGGKLWVAGVGAGAALAPLLVQALGGRFERERPPLAAVLLREEPALPLAQQLAALGQPGDLLVLVDGAAASAPLRQAAQAAQAGELTVIVIGSADGQAWAEVLGETDLWVAVPHGRASRVAELQLLVLHCLCDAVDLQLLGEQESS
jgi:D-sedoheptulose 7-phosphate isomerase